MLAFDCEDIPKKEDSTVAALSGSKAAAVGGSNAALSQPAPSTTTTTTADSEASSSGPAGIFHTQFRPLTKFLRDTWTQRRPRVHKDHSPLLVISALTLAGLVCSVAAISSNNWTCHGVGTTSFGLWNTCYMPAADAAAMEAEIDELVENKTSVTVAAGVQNTTAGKVLCAQQGLYEVKLDLATQSRVDQVSAAQGLIVSGTVLYAFSLVSVVLAYKFIKAGNLNSLRNALVASVCVQVVSFLLHLIGFFLFVLTDRVSTSIGLLFVYFGLAIFATNIINFITIEYKSYKNRQISI